MLLKYNFSDAEKISAPLLIIRKKQIVREECEVTQT